MTLSGRWKLVLTAGAIALALGPSSSASAEAKPEALTKLVDTIHVPTPANVPSGVNEYIPSKVKLDQGEDYRMVVDGYWEQYYQRQEDTTERWHHFDSLYCFLGPGCFGDATIGEPEYDGYMGLLVGLESDVQGDVGSKAIHKFAGDPLPPFTKINRYQVVFRAKRSERLMFLCNCVDAHTVQLFPDYYRLASGDGFDIFLLTARDELRRCPEMRTDDGEHGSANRRCEYGVPWKVKQSGLQANPAVKPESDLISTTTTAEGVIYFSDEPDFGADERVKGAVLRFHIRQVDEYLRTVPSGPEAFEYEVSEFTARTSLLTSVRGGRDGVELTVLPYLASANTHGCEPSLGVLKLFDAGANDRMRFSGYGCHLDREFVSGEAENEQLKVRIGKPQRLKGT